MKQKCILIAALSALALVACNEDLAVPTATTDSYPLEVCVVSGEALGSMGDPIIYDHEGTTVKFCCKSCIKDFKADPAPYLEKLEKVGAK